MLRQPDPPGTFESRSVDSQSTQGVSGTGLGPEEGVAAAGAKDASHVGGSPLWIGKIKPLLP
jgi:hypothetical protein